MNPLDWAAAAVLLLSLFLGLWRGLVYEVLSVAVKIGAAVGATDLSWPTADEPLLDALPRGQTVAAAGVLFSKIEDTQVAEWSERFGGADA